MSRFLGSCLRARTSLTDVFILWLRGNVCYGRVCKPAFWWLKVTHFMLNFFSKPFETLWLLQWTARVCIYSFIYLFTGQAKKKKQILQFSHYMDLKILRLSARQLRTEWIRMAPVPSPCMWFILLFQMVFFFFLSNLTFNSFIVLPNGLLSSVSSFNTLQNILYVSSYLVMYSPWSTIVQLPMTL